MCVCPFSRICSFAIFFMIFGKIFSLKMSSFIFWWYKVPVLLYLKLMTLSFIICHQNYVCFCTWAAKSLKGTHLNCKLTKLIVLVTDLWQYGGLWKSKSLKSVQKRWFLEYGWLLSSLHPHGLFIFNCYLQFPVDLTLKCALKLGPKMSGSTKLPSLLLQTYACVFWFQLYSFLFATH